MKSVGIYTSRSCPYCTNAKRLLQSKGVFFTEFIVDGDPKLAAEAVEKSGGRKTVPQIFIENHHVGGYDDIVKLDKEGKLNSLMGLDK